MSEADSNHSSQDAAGATSPVVFFDGVCGLCNSWVDWVLRADRAARFRFAPLQGETARARLPADDVASLGSMVLADGDRVLRHSTAVATILWRLGGLCALAGALLFLVPRPLRDLGYRIVAANRYRWFGKKESCRMPTPAERARFLP